MDGGGAGKLGNSLALCDVRCREMYVCMFSATQKNCWEGHEKTAMPSANKGKAEECEDAQQVPWYDVCTRSPTPEGAHLQDPSITM